MTKNKLKAVYVFFRKNTFKLNFCDKFAFKSTTMIHE